MNCLPDMCIALWLIAFSLGVFLLLKVQKENLTWPFRAAGWMIVVVALGGMLCCTFRCMMKQCCRETCPCPPMMVAPMHHGWSAPCHGKKSMCNHEECENDEECCEEEEHGCRNPHGEKPVPLMHVDSAKAGKK